MADLSHLPPEVRMAGVAYVVTEMAKIESTAEDGHTAVHAPAYHWAVMRGLPMGKVGDMERAIGDAVTYRSEHTEDVTEFLRLTRRRVTG